jgi:hypothetical protein
MSGKGVVHNVRKTKEILSEVVSQNINNVFYWRFLICRCVR